MKRRYLFKNGRVTEDFTLHSLLTESPRKPGGAVVLLTTQPEVIERGRKDETAAET